MSDIDLLSAILDYNKDTGDFTYKKSQWIGRKRNESGLVGYHDKDGYLIFSTLGTTKKLHRVAWLFVNKSYPKGQIDHINGVRDDNRICNLRDVSMSENSKNRRVCSNNNSGMMGVCWHKEKGKWHARITNKGKVTHIGYFKNIDDAFKARKEHEIKNEFHKNHGRT